VPLSGRKNLEHRFRGTGCEECSLRPDGLRCQAALVGGRAGGKLGATRRPDIGTPSAAVPESNCCTNKGDGAERRYGCTRQVIARGDRQRCWTWLGFWYRPLTRQCRPRLSRHNGRPGDRCCCATRWLARRRSQRDRLHQSVVRRCIRIRGGALRLCDGVVPHMGRLLCAVLWGRRAQGSRTTVVNTALCSLSYPVLPMCMSALMRDTCPCIHAYVRRGRAAICRTCSTYNAYHTMYVMCAGGRGHPTNHVTIL